MNQAIEGAVGWLNEKIAALTELRDRLVKVFTELERLASAPVPTRPPIWTAKKRKVKREPRASGASQSGAESPQSKTLARPATPAGTVSGKPVSTVAGAMKLAIAGLNGKEFTVADLTADLDVKYSGAEFWQGKSASAISGNLSYWSSKGNLAKTETGYRAANKEFFSSVEY